MPHFNYNLELSRSSSEINYCLREDYQWTKVDQETEKMMKR